MNKHVLFTVVEPKISPVTLYVKIRNLSLIQKKKYVHKYTLTPFISNATQLSYLQAVYHKFILWLAWGPTPMIKKITLTFDGKIKWPLVLLLITALAGCKHDPDLYINGAPYYLEERCVKEHYESHPEMKYGWNPFTSKYELHYDYLNQLYICDSSTIDTIPVN